MTRKWIIYNPINDPESMEILARMRQRSSEARIPREVRIAVIYHKLEPWGA